MYKRFVSIPFIMVMVLAYGCQQEKSAALDSITVFCGSASKPVMAEIGVLFEREKNIKVNLIFGGSGSLLSQIELAKQGEIYLPGSPDYILIAKRKGLLREDSDRIVAYLVPGIITPKDNPAQIQSLQDLAATGIRVGIGNPETVCLGLYGIELLEHNNLLAQIMKNVVTFGGSCSKTVNLVALNQVDAILGWRVFHFWNPERMNFVPIAPEQIPRISYIPIAIPVYTKSVELSQAFIDFVLSEHGQAVYQKFGYLATPDQARQFAPKAKIGGEYSLPEVYPELLKGL